VKYFEEIKVENLQEKFECFVHPDVLLIVRSTARHDIQLLFSFSANALEIRTIQSPKCIV
jgi:hypothetical protein